MEHGLEAAKVALGEAAQGPVLERQEVLVDASRRAGAAPGEPHRERSPVLRPDVPGHVPAGLQPVEVTRQGRALVGEGPVQVGDRAGAGLGQVSEEVALALGEVERRLGGVEVQADAMGGASTKGTSWSRGFMRIWIVRIRI